MLRKHAEIAMVFRGYNELVATKPVGAETAAYARAFYRYCDNKRCRWHK